MARQHKLLCMVGIFAFLFGCEFRDTQNQNYINLNEQTSRAIVKKLILKGKIGQQLKDQSAFRTKAIVSCKRINQTDVDFDCSLVTSNHQTFKKNHIKKISKKISHKWTEFFGDINDRLLLENHIVMDLNCNYISSKLPPYKQENYNCKVEQPRAVDETIVRGKVATIVSHQLSNLAKRYSDRPNELKGEFSVAHGDEENYCQLHIDQTHRIKLKKDHCNKIKTALMKTYQYAKLVSEMASSEKNPMNGVFWYKGSISCDISDLFLNKSGIAECRIKRLTHSLAVTSH